MKLTRDQVYTLARKLRENYEEKNSQKKEVEKLRNDESIKSAYASIDSKVSVFLDSIPKELRSNVKVKLDYDKLSSENAINFIVKRKLKKQKELPSNYFEDKVVLASIECETSIQLKKKLGIEF